ncbi:dienelactone hydrolase [filamentous cyanobacterium CCT1]|nr:dienelactone hydrolase [filamentous cyanobacterium CCT1]PSN79149.1 dienelactone hydrolase [filamentous cyanobacterium CCP4]
MPCGPPAGLIFPCGRRCSCCFPAKSSGNPNITPVPTSKVHVMPPSQPTHPSLGWGRFLFPSVAALAALALTPLTGSAAESVYFDFRLLGRSVPTASLAHFAETGEADAALAPYLRRLSPEQKDRFREALTATQPVDVVHLSQWFYSPIGEQILLFAGNLIETEGRLNGQRAIRAALIAAAAEDGEISLLDVIDHFPTRDLRLDLNQVLSVVRQVEAERSETLAVVEAISQQSLAAAAAAPVDVAALPDLTQPGPYSTRRLTLTLQDPSRSQRTYPVDVFLPENLAAVPGQLPIVVVSHGLGDSRTSFLDLERMATYGFVVALPEHIGSNSSQKAALLSGLDHDLLNPREFLDRPLDISFLLDELERTNASQYQGKLNVQQVAVIGHSFGGYTALALAGATIDFASLSEECTPEANILLNAAQLLECRALELRDDPAVAQRLGIEGVGDDRVKAVIAFAPVSHLFGPQGIRRIQIPTVILGGAFDIVTRVVPQQVEAFSWLTTEEKYLYLYENTSHTPQLTRLVTSVFHVYRDFDQGVEEALELNRDTSKTLAIAFAQVYLKGDRSYEPFLGSAYIEAVSQEPLQRHLVRELPESQQFFSE